MHHYWFFIYPKYIFNFQEFFMAPKTAEKGNLSVSTENLFPIIKKWLYSEKEIYLRELVSNAVDAITKLKSIAGMDKEVEAADPAITIALDKKAGTLTIGDNGIGMTADEIKKYINQIAFSGAEDFLEKYKGKEEKDQIIGHFGLGFYSAFMVSSKVEIRTLSYQKDAQAVHWTCEGNNEFTLDEIEKDGVGTEIVLHILKDEREMLEDDRIKEIVKKFCNFLPYPIYVNGTVANDQHPLWLKKPAECKDEDYKEFYKKMFPMSEDPLFWIHLNVDYPFHLTGVMYFPMLRGWELDPRHHRGLHLYCSQVYVTDNVVDILPEFLSLLQGAIDSPDIPLNVSRSYLQTDPNVSKISNHIIKKVGDALADMSKNDQKRLTEIWPNVSPIVKFGMMNHDKFYDRMKPVMIYKSTNGEYTTIDDYLTRNKDKNKDTVLYASSEKEQVAYIEMLKKNDMEALILDAVIDAHFINFLESKDQKVKFKRIDSDLSEFFVQKDKPTEIIDPKDNKTPSQKIEDLFKKNIAEEKLTVKVEHLKNAEISGVITLDENMRRFKDMMSAMSRESIPQIEDHTLVVNANNGIVKSALTMAQQGKSDECKLLCEHIYDLAMIQQNALKGEKMTKFVERANRIMGMISK